MYFTFWSDSFFKKVLITLLNMRLLGSLRCRRGSILEKAISPTDQSSGSKAAVYKPDGSLFLSLGQTFLIPLIAPPPHLWYSSHLHDIVKIVNVPLKFRTRTKLILTCCRPHSVKWWPFYVDDFALKQQPKTSGIAKFPITLCWVPPDHSCTKHCSPFEYSSLLFGICWLYLFIFLSSLSYSYWN